MDSSETYDHQDLFEARGHMVDQCTDEFLGAALKRALFKLNDAAMRIIQEAMDEEEFSRPPIPLDGRPVDERIADAFRSRGMCGHASLPEVLRNYPFDGFCRLPVDEAGACPEHGNVDETPASTDAR